jgi:competence protein ComEC
MLYYLLLALAFRAIPLRGLISQARGLAFAGWRRPAAAAVAAAAVLCAALFVWARHLAPCVEIVFLDVGNANAAYINVGGKYSIAVDAGGKASFQTSGDAASEEKRLYEYLLGRGVRKLDLAIATHGDSDHSEGFWRLLADMPVDRMLISGTDDAEIDEIAAFARSKNVEIIECRSGDALALGDMARIEVVSPYPERAGAGSLQLGGTAAFSAAAGGSGQSGAPGTSDGGAAGGALSLNERSLVVRLVYGDMKALFCGDIGNVTEGRLASDGADISAQVISVPHHGSRFSSTEPFLKAVAPKAAVFGVGKNNYGHPSPEAIGRYLDIGAEVFRTDLDGMATICGGRDGKFSVKCYNDDENAYAWQR